MRRYWVPASAVHEDQVTFRDDIYHHVVDVCRMQVGAKFEVLTGDGRALFCEMTSVGPRAQAVARVLEVREIAPLPLPHVHLCVSLSRFATMDAIVEKSVELGVTSFHPFFSAHSFLKQADKVSPTKVERWHKIIRSATQQSGRGTLMELSPAQALGNLLQSSNRLSESKGLFAYEGECELSLKEGLQVIRQAQPQHLWVFVGSEGGFSVQEVDQFRTQGLEPLSLGSQVLRVETACLALVSIIKYEFA